ncbi:efflux RND transporter periplasmic adaptor subunit [Flammeovirgaceae bacterium SG7u.111]|nr:efflux RND transporter periplasmic adaptor subunit [Flammeovirgaceae bacterium SG7u.132]WPO37746.1 efflux RND transporter periplasmic adaptor subunit [Flammeovirgaceae bacterium SG7u.111]
MKQLLIIIITFSLAQFFTSCGSEERKSTETLDPIMVKVSKIKAGKNDQYFTASGKVEAENSSNLSTRMMGYVTGLKVKVGQQVSKGQLLLSINNTDLQAKKAQVEASIIQAEAGYANAKKDYERFKTLFEQKSASQKELDDMTTRYEMAKAGLEAAKQMKNEVIAQFAYANITAPFSGIVTNTFVKEGDMANPGMPLLSIETRSNLQVMAMVSETDIDAIENGMLVKVLVKSQGTEVDGKVSEVSLSAKNTGGQYLVKIDLDTTNGSILSGMFVHIRFPVTKASDATSAGTVLIPKSALVKNGQLEGVYTIGNENVAILRWLRIGKTYGDQVEVLSGISTDEQFITSSEGKLFNGAKVEFQVVGKN